MYSKTQNFKRTPPNYSRVSKHQYYCLFNLFQLLWICVMLSSVIWYTGHSAEDGEWLVQSLSFLSSPASGYCTCEVHQFIVRFHHNWILWMRTSSAEMLWSKMTAGVWMPNYACLWSIFFQRLSWIIVCVFSTDFTSRCACPEALEKPKGLDTCLPCEW